MTEQNQTQQTDKSEAQRKAEDGRKAYADAEKQMTDRHLAERIRAAYPHAAEQGPDAVKAMMEDYRRLESEQQNQGQVMSTQNQGQGQGQGTHPQGGPPGQTGEHPQGGAPGQQPKPQPKGPAG